MKLLSLGASLALVLAGCSRSEPRPVSLDESTSAAQTASAERVEPERPAETAGASGDAGERIEVAPPADPEPALAAAPPPASCHIFGRLLDESRQPIAGARVWLGTPRDEWAPGAVTTSGGDLGREHGFAGATDASGNFRLEVPVPTCDWITLEIRPDPYHALVRESFHPTGFRPRRFEAGDNDIGEFTSARAGALSGRVIDADSEPASGVHVSLKREDGNWTGQRVTTGEDGGYAIENIPSGTYAVEASRTGSLNAKSAGTKIAVGTTTRLADLVFAVSPTISGVVVDEAGSGIANAAVHGWPVSSGHGAFARTDAEGRFQLELRQAEPHWLQVEARGFADSGRDAAMGNMLRLRTLQRELDEGSNAEAAEFLRASGAQAVGATDVRIVMIRPNLTTFVVLDAASSQPVTRFGLKLVNREIELPGGVISHTTGGNSERAVADHPGGEFECAAEPERQTFRIEAPGYSPAEGIVVHESAESRRCVVRLSSGGTLAGRVVQGGAPVAGATVTVHGQTLAELHGGRVIDENDAYWNEYGETTSPYTFSQDSREVKSEADGRFRVDSLAPGDYRVELLSTSGDRRALEPVLVGTGAAPLDMGDVELQRAGTLRGRLILPPGTSKQGIEVTVWAFDIEATARTDAEGRFVLGKRSPGRHHLWFPAKPGVLADGPVVHVEIGPGETKELELDFSERAGCFVRVEVRVNGELFEGADVTLTASADAEKSVVLLDRDSREGPAWEQAIGPVEGTVRTKSGMPLAIASRVGELTPGGDASIRLDCVCGGVSLRWPAIPSTETEPFVRFAVKRAGAEAGFDVSADDDADGERGAAPNRWSFDRVAAGEFEWTASIYSGTASGDRVARVYRKKATVLPRETIEVSFTEADRVEER